ncbi:MAG: UDP-N-acetylmuramoyl-L-alanine--D-glutamate ligase [Candidatus Hydrogenedentes bacterium]|nr:UDP-N-acetylmuramoyl-L-alanine--D-glutamate ligase [Candidatus Hydrogenedentota bacterium]
MDLQGVPVTIVGLGRSAAAAAALLRAVGARPFVTDSADTPPQAPWRAELEELGVPFETGGHTDRAWDAAGLVVLSPGVPPSIAPVQALRKRGVPVLGELELASRFARAPLLAVTGTNGKTTVTEMLRHILVEIGYRAALAGNNHTAFSSAVLADPSPDYFVLEVSSYQLETIETFRPYVGAVLNLTPDHLGRHGDLDGYAAAKARLFLNQQPGKDVAVLNGDDPRVRTMAVPEGVRHIHFQLEAVPETGLGWDGAGLVVDGQSIPMRCPLPGRHNLENALAALAVLHGAGLSIPDSIRALESFRGVAHRLEFAGSRGGIAFYNDSKSTNVDSLRVALEAFEQPVTLIAGGQGKGSSYTPLAPLVRARVRHLVALGEDGPVLARALSEAAPVTVVRDMAAAVAEAIARTPPGGTVLLSPGCASFDQYANFEERGAHFKALVGALTEEECLS